MSDRPRYTTLLGGAVGGVGRDEVAQIVTNLVASREHDLELTIRPERIGSKYTIAWTTLRFDHEAQEWVPLYNRSEEDTKDT